MRRLANQQDLARAAGVSVSTVSRALSDSRGISSELRAQIKKLAQELGYKARGVAPLEARTVRAYVTTSVMSGSLVAFYSALVDGLQTEASLAGLTLEVRLVRQTLDEARLAGDAEEAVAGSFLVGLDLTPSIVDFFGPDRPLVLVNTFDPKMRYDCVAPNNFYGAFWATEQLLDAGHRKLLHLREQLRWTTHQRELGFFAAIARVPGASGEIYDIRTDGDAALAEAARRKAAGEAEWTGVYAVHDNSAIRFIHALEEAGLRVPRDLSVVGFDDLPSASMLTPRLTTMRVDCGSLAREAIRLLLRRLAEPNALPLQAECAVVPVRGGSVTQLS
jgi:DNA-binding LacI/PurR family transcriptional regulator